MAGRVETVRATETDGMIRRFWQAFRTGLAAFWEEYRRLSEDAAEAHHMERLSELRTRREMREIAAVGVVARHAQR